METNQPAALNPSNPTDTLKPKPPKHRIKKLTAAEIVGLPGASPAPEKKVEPDLAYYLFFNLPVTGPVGTPAEATQVHDFAYKLSISVQI